MTKEERAKNYVKDKSHFIIECGGLSGAVRKIYTDACNEQFDIDVEKACTEVKHILENELRENDTLSGVWVSDLIASVILNLEQAMKG